MRVALLGTVNQFGTGPLEVRRRSIPVGIEYLPPESSMIKITLPYHMRVPFFVHIINRFIPHLDSLCWDGGFPSYIHVKRDIDLVHSVFLGHWALYDKPWIHDTDGTLWAYLTRVRGARPEEIGLTMKLAGKILSQRKCRKLICWTKFAAEEASEKYCVPDEKITVIPPAVSVPEKRPKKETDDKTILYVGTDWRLKGGDTVLKVFRILSNRDESIRLLYVGPCPPAFQDSITRNPNILWFPSIPHSQVLREVMPGADLVFIPARAEAFGLSILEAMSFGIPAVISPTSSAGELVIHGVNGLVNDQPGLSSYVNLIHSMIDDDVLRERLGKNASAKARRDFSPEIIGRRLKEVYEECLGR